MSDRYQDTMDKALQCIHLARAINDRYDDPSKMPAEEVANRKSLLTEAMRLQEIADTERSQSRLEAWASAPDADSPAVTAMASKAMTDAKVNGGADQFAQANHELTVKRFAKALKFGKDSLNTEEKASIIENTTGQIIVPHDLAGPIFLQLPRLGVLRDLALVRPTTSNLVDVRALTGVTAGWGQVEITNTGGATPATYAAIAATGPNTGTGRHPFAMALIGQGDRLFGGAYYRVTGLPAPGSAPAVLFGDIRSGYLIADRQRITVQRLDERYADQGLVAFIFRERVGGDVIRPAAFAKYLV